MTPEERKAIAMRERPTDGVSSCEPAYPYCCQWHEGFDAALALPSHPHYTSTYCIHGRHEECRLTCKICGRKCLCTCHT